MVEKFKRPESQLFPLIHHTFMAKDAESDELVEYYIQDLTEDKTDEALEMYAKCLYLEETIQKAVKISESPDTVELLNGFYGKAIKDRFSLGCFKMGSHELVGINLLRVKARGSKEDHDVPDPTLKHFLKVIAYLDSKFDVAEHYDVDYHLSGLGLGVDPKYRGKGIATELLRARVSLLQTLGLNFTSTSFTGIGSQKSAAKAGYEESYALSYEEIQKEFPELDLSSTSATHWKIMSLRI